MTTRKVGIIGLGNMGGAIVQGVLAKGYAAGNDVYAFDADAAKCADACAALGIQQSDSLEALTKTTSVLLLSVKPQDLPKVGEAIGEQLSDDHVLISILAGMPIAVIQKHVGGRGHVIRAMPNLGAKVGESLTAVTGGDEKSVHVAKEIFDCCGQTIEVEERYFDLITAASGSGPAYFFFLMQVIAEFAEKEGLPPEVAQLLSVQTALGAAKLAAASDENPGELKRRVTSKGGTTEAALKFLEESGAREQWLNALAAALERGKELDEV